MLKMYIVLLLLLNDITNIMMENNRITGKQRKIILSPLITSLIIPTISYPVKYFGLPGSASFSGHIFLQPQNILGYDDHPEL